jgi:S-adenosylmethionine:tRNA ribosyltransferase-isomerase
VQQWQSLNLSNNKTGHGRFYYLKIIVQSSLMDLEQFKYEFDHSLIANEPAKPRESARLFVYHTKTDVIEHRNISDLPEILAGSLVVVNDTTVHPARVMAIHNNQKLELLLLLNEATDNGRIKALVNRRVKTGEEIKLDKINFVVEEDHEKSMLLSYDVNLEELINTLKSVGEMPLPPYIKTESTEAEKRDNYQTVFASGSPSVAAPTASLHFTENLIERIKERGANFANVTLQVGLGTFAPVFADNFESKKLHKEYFSISHEAATQIKTAKQIGRKVVSVGTTVSRVLESAQVEIMNSEGLSSSTDIFIFPPYHFTIPDALLTNFHVPKSSLMCLVEAFLKDKGSKRSLVDLYKVAISERYRLFSFGDAMLIL